MEIDYSCDDILKYLSPPIKNDGMVIKSPYMACLQDARDITGRDISTGTKNLGKIHYSWLGALAYMVLIDHIGNKFEAKDKDKKKYFKKINYFIDFIHALVYFSILSEEEIFALYALRCSFAHDYFLLNTNKKNQKLNHHFSVTAGQHGHFVLLPKIQWDGRIETRNDENITVINLELLGDLVEDIHDKLLLNVYSKNIKVRKGAILNYITYAE